jgi:hypothetical protein
MRSELTNEATRREWRELGFFYDRDDNSKRWRFVGDQKGLRRFAALLRKYAVDPRKAAQSEHDHFGPYMYLKLMTWPDPGLDGNAIYGPVDQLARLAGVVERHLAAASPGECRSIGEEFVRGAEYQLVLEVRAEGFDPASEDASLVAGAG